MDALRTFSIVRACVYCKVFGGGGRLGGGGRGKEWEWGGEVALAWYWGWMW